MDLEGLVEKSKEIFNSLKVTEEQSVQIEETTRQQSKSKLWFEMRCGRITASKSPQACHTNPDTLSVSLINVICYGSHFSSDATKWDCDHEKQALKEYEQVMQSKHENFHIKEYGLVVSPQYPHLGASPDSMSLCTCCGQGVLEVKCPSSIKSSKIPDAIHGNRDFYVEET
ncbi:hypothetical protein AWC38_SpisGene24040 [Stylophora pistillata]|uniref:YqaJ viral recombinase domain-containing protein n=1 Tax=Stylophora pistillata TaxID=50429 RepID=A0A2B4R365_STYPI|nr:hypothetical protein AWC38_SpisGene24040 [Stylophora pistillata]